MPYSTIFLTKQLLDSQMTRLYNKYNNLRKQNYRYSKEYLYCGICREKINEKDIGKMMVTCSTKKNPARKWQHLECSIQKGITLH